MHKVHGDSLTCTEVKQISASMCPNSVQLCENAVSLTDGKYICEIRCVKSPQLETELVKYLCKYSLLLVI